MVQGRMKKVNYKSKKNIRLPQNEWKIVNNTHEPLIDLNTFLMAKEMINLRKQTRIKSHDYILKGFVYCHECGKKMYCSSRHLASGTKYYFRCSSNTSNNNSCSPHSIRMDVVQDLVLNVIYDLMKKNYNKTTFTNIVKQCYCKYLKERAYADKIDFYKVKISELSVEIDKLYSDKISRHIRGG